MNISSRILRVFAAMGVILLSACQSTDAKTYAVLVSADDQTMTALKSVLASALGQASVEIGPGDLTKTSVVAVLPPRLAQQEDRSVVQPDLFDLMINGAKCIVVRRQTGEEYDLRDVSCRSL